MTPSAILLAANEALQVQLTVSGQLIVNAENLVVQKTISRQFSFNGRWCQAALMERIYISIGVQYIDL